MSGSRRRTGSQQQVRIIGGEWRGRKLSFDALEGLRPTGDRVRETLFNWLAPDIAGARCADLFAGTGALGLEALSRGAAHCDFVDQSREVITRLKGHLDTLGAPDRGHCHRSTAEQFLEQATGPFDIVFVDPPFSLELTAPVLDALVRCQLLHDQALVYVESGANSPLPGVPDNWHLHRDKVAGAVAYRLYRAGSPDCSP